MTTQRFIGLINIIVIFSTCRFAFAQVGDRCVVKHSGRSGSCAISRDCPEVEEQAKNGISPTICGFYQLTTPIVCCERKTGLPEPNENSFLNINEEGNPNDNHNEGGGDSIIYPDNVHGISNNQGSSSLKRSKSEEKCAEYLKPLTSVLQVIPLLTNTDAVDVHIEKCDNVGLPLIVGGKPAGMGEFPFMAALGFYEGERIDWKCGATLISERYVVTAAHCTFTRDSGQPQVVRLGEIDLTKSDGRSLSTDYLVRNITVHPEYNYPMKYNDIALIKLNRRINKFTKLIRPACLFTKSEIDQTEATATGFGKTDFAAADNVNKLMKVSLNIFDNSRCAHTYHKDKKNLPYGIASGMLCAGELRGGKDTCQGDSGGPLIVVTESNQCKFYIIGVTSFGKSCGEANTPAVYTRISEYIQWIEDAIW